MWDMLDPLVLFAFIVAWLGHACIWVSILSNLFGRALPKPFLKTWRFLTALIILAFPLVWEFQGHTAACCYLRVSGFVGGVVFPIITVMRAMRRPPACVVSEVTRTHDLWAELGKPAIGDGNLHLMAGLPGNGLLNVDITELKLSLPGLPPEWEGLTLLVLSDLHFHGTPARPFFERIIDELASASEPDLVCLIGDYVDTDTHHEWIGPILGRLHGTEGKLAILGNHDKHHNPERVRGELTAAGYTVLGNTGTVVAIRGVPCFVLGHEGPWFAPEPDLSTAPPEMFRLCLSHTPDNFYWGIRHGIGLMLCGHVHGGAIRLPVIGSIFVPSIYGRRFDQGIFEKQGMVMVVNRGVSGKEPIRFRCNPQVMRITLTRR
jgi:predicted MPP superfamily phosphohydrolase